VLGKWLNLRAFQPRGGEVDQLIGALLESPERERLLAELTANPGIRRGEQMLSDYEVLASSSADPLQLRFRFATIRRDEAAAAAVVARARAAKSIDVSQTAQARALWVSGANDAEFFESSASTLARLEAVAAIGKLDARTRGAAMFLIAITASPAGLYQGDAALLRRGRDAGIEAMKLWPALDAVQYVIGSLIDEAAMASDAKLWISLRRTRAPISVLTKLAAESAPLAAAIKASPQWLEVARFARGDLSRPALNTIRLARLLGDPALEQRALPAFDDKLLRSSLQLNAILDPSDPATKEDLEMLDRR
jgi:hypothetical protein